MKIGISGRPDYAMIHLGMDAGESIVAESGAMVSRTAGIAIETAARGGILESAKRALLGGESFFVNTFTAKEAGRLALAPGCPGDVIHVPLNGELIVQKGSFIAATPGIKLDTKWAGLKGFFSGEGFFLLQALGQGDLFLSSYGAIEEVEVNGDYIVDTGHIVAFESALSYNVQKLGNWRQTILSGEFLVCRFSGRGKVWIQTRAVQPFAHWIHPFRRVKPKSNN